LGAKGIKRSGFFSEKRFFAKFCLKNQFFYKIFFHFAKLKTFAHFLNQSKIPLLLIPFRDYFEDIFFNSYKGMVLLFSHC